MGRRTIFRLDGNGPRLAVDLAGDDGHFGVIQFAAVELRLVALDIRKRTDATEGLDSY